MIFETPLVTNPICSSVLPSSKDSEQARKGKLKGGTQGNQFQPWMIKPNPVKHDNVKNLHYLRQLTFKFYCFLGLVYFSFFFNYLFLSLIAFPFIFLRWLSKGSRKTNITIILCTSNFMGSLFISLLFCPCSLFSYALRKMFLSKLGGGWVMTFWESDWVLEHLSSDHYMHEFFFVCLFAWFMINTVEDMMFFSW